MIKKIFNKNNWLIIFFLPLSILILIIIILFKPFVTIRLGYLLTYRFGHSIKDLEMYLSEKKITEKGNKYIDFFFLSFNPANNYIQKKSKEYLNVLPATLLIPAYKIIEKMGNKYDFFKSHYIEMRNYDYDPKNYLDKIDCQISFSSQEITEGDNQLKKIGIEKDDMIVCLCSRDKNYAIKNLYGGDKSNKSTENLMDIRNSQIENYSLASKELVKLGYKVVRMGKDTGKEIDFANDKIIDYSKSKFRSDFLDLYLAYRCKFAFGDSAGWTQAPIVFRKYVALTNWAPYALIDFVGKNFYIFKHYYDKNLKKNLNIREIFNRNLHKLFLFDLQKQNMILKDNTPQEILDLVLEVESKASNKKDNTITNPESVKFRTFLKENKFFIRENNPNLPQGRLVSKYSIRSNFGENFLKKFF